MQHRSILICTLLAVAVVAWAAPAQSQVGDFDEDGVITPTDYVEYLPVCRQTAPSSRSISILTRVVFPVPLVPLIAIMKGLVDINQVVSSCRVTFGAL